jgi:hypothetical protein
VQRAGAVAPELTSHSDPNSRAEDINRRVLTTQIISLRLILTRIRGVRFTRYTERDLNTPLKFRSVLQHPAFLIERIWLACAPFRSARSVSSCMPPIGVLQTEPYGSV